MITIDEPRPPMEGVNMKSKIPGLFKEEDAAFKAVRKLFERGPSRVMINIQGAARPYTRNKNTLADLRGMYVYIRDDGWTLACHKDHADVAHELWKTNWIARVDVGAILGSASTVEVFTENLSYHAGTVDEEGLITGLTDEVKERHFKAIEADNPGPEAKSLDDIREWMRHGCPDD